MSESLANGEVRIRLFGTVEASCGGRTVRFAGHKQRAIVALLALHAGKVVAAERLIDSIWGDDPPITVRSSVQVHISQIRRAFADAGAPAVIETRSPGYLLVVPRDAVDLHQFTEFVEQARAAVYSDSIADAGRSARAALELGSGDVLAELHDVGFAAAAAAQVAVLRLEMTELAADADMAAGHHDAAAADLEGVAAAHPFREPTWERLALALYRCGRQADALERLARLRSTLLDELGLDPSAPILALEHAILRQDESLHVRREGVSTNHQPIHVGRLPTTRPLVAREGLITSVTELLSSQRLVTLVGTGGVGKSSVANHVAARRFAEHGDTVSYVDLALVDTGALVAASIGTALGLRAGSGGIDAADVIEFLGDRAMLLYLDTCEHVIDAVAEFIDALLSSSGGSRVLAASRESLRVRDECVVDVPSLTLGQSVELFRSRVLPGPGGLDGGGYDDETMAQICSNLGGVPLAVELVCARARISTPHELHRQTRELALLRLDRRGTEPRHRSLESTIGWSYDLLQPHLQQLLRRLAVFRGGFTADVAQIMRVDDPLGDIRPDLDALLSKSLLAADRSQDSTRFRLLDTVTLFADQRLRESGERDTVRRVHLDYVLAMASSIRAELEGTDPAGALTALAAEEANIRTAHQTCIDIGDDQARVALVGAFGPFGLGTSGVIAEFGEWVKAALTVSPVAPQHRLNLLLVACWYLEMPAQQHLALAQEALRLAETTPDQAAQSFALGCLADASGDDAVDEILQRAVNLADGADRLSLVAWPAVVFLNVLFRRHDTGRASALLEHLLSRDSQQYGFMEGNVHYQRARLALTLGNIAEARIRYDEAMAASLRTGSLMSLGWAHFGLGQLNRDVGDLPAARHHYEQALAIDTRISSRETTADRWRMVRICIAQGDLDTAGIHVRAMERETASGQSRLGAAATLAARGALENAQGSDQNALRSLLAATEALAALSVVSWFAEVADDLARCSLLSLHHRDALVRALAGLRDRTATIDHVMTIIRNE